MTVPKSLEGVVASDPEILGGTPCFAGTRVPITTLIDYVESGFSLNRFLRGYSSVSRDQGVAVLEWQSDQARKALGPELV